MKDEHRIKQCCTCEETFVEYNGECCPHCGSGDFVYGYIDEPEPKKRVAGEGTTHWYVCCACGGAIDYVDKFCRHCGTSLEEE